jgi:DNA repair protein RadC
MNVKLTKTQRILIQSSEDIARIMRQILLRENRVSREREHLWAIGLGEELNILYVELIGLSSQMEKIKPMEVYKLALQKDASYLYLCHNRKGKDMSAQASDKALTDRMIQVGNIVGITLFDHVVICSKTEDFLSFADIGMMDELRKSLAWVPKFEQVQKIKKMATEQAELKKAQEIAKTMKRNNVDGDLISKFTGLSLKEIEKL